LLRKGLGLTLVVAAFAAGCFTDPVNMPPSIRIDSPAAQTFRGQPVTYTATIFDPDNGSDVPRLEWAWVPGGNCPAGFHDAKTWPPATAWKVEDKQTVTPDPRGPACVWARATDKSGAVDVDAVTCFPLDHAPSVGLQQVSPPPADGGTFLPNTVFEFAAGASDPDEGDQARLSVSWAIKSAPADGGVLGLCADDTDPFKQCLTANDVGTYVVAATVSDAVDGGADGASASSTESVTVVVAPGPPPVAEISVESFTPSLKSDDGQYALGASFRLSSITSHRADGSAGVKPHWIKLRTPDGAETNLRDATSFSAYSCGPAAPDSILCFTADKPGTYHVELAVDDGLATSAIVGRDFVVAPDQPPCIGQLSFVPPKNPDTIIPLQDIQISVLEVKDDRDPFPGFNAIAWFREEPSGNGGAPTFVFRGDFGTFPLRDEGRSGDVVKVRLEVHDRDLDASNQGFIACGGAPTCSLPNLFFRSCVQRMTFNVRLP
jgi:hypothetical protein